MRKLVFAIISLMILTLVSFFVFADPHNCWDYVFLKDSQDCGEGCLDKVLNDEICTYTGEGGWPEGACEYFGDGEVTDENGTVFCRCYCENRCELAGYHCAVSGSVEKTEFDAACKPDEYGRQQYCWESAVPEFNSTWVIAIVAVVAAAAIFVIKRNK